MPKVINVRDHLLLKSRMFCEVERNVKMTRCRLKGGDGEVGMAMETGEQGEMLGAGRG